MQEAEKVAIKSKVKDVMRSMTSIIGQDRQVQSLAAAKDVVRRDLESKSVFVE